MTLTLRFYKGESWREETVCTGLFLEWEAYTPYGSLTAEYLTETDEIPTADKVVLRWGEQEIFQGIADSIEAVRQNGRTLLRVKSKGFTSALVQNELEPGMHEDVTIETLLNGFYQFPHVTYETNGLKGYIFVKDGMSLWDNVARFGFRATGHYPYVRNDRVMLQLPASPMVHTVPEGLLLAEGTSLDTARAVSHYHMEDITGTANAYEMEEPSVTDLGIIRHKQIPMDRQFLYDPEDALRFRLRYALRGSRAQYLMYAGFDNEQVGDLMQFGNDWLTVCRVQLRFGAQGLRTKVWAYRDGFYNKG